MDQIERLNQALEGRYAVQRELGRGGMATVYLADDLKHARQVAVKVLKPEISAVLGAERFLSEIRTTANLQHPNILPLFDSGEADGQLFYVMPYVEGESLRERLDREQQLPVDDALSILNDLAEALQEAHDAGVIHRDIKPANILLRKGKPLLSDFGIALAVSAAGEGRLTETGLSLGTPFYMSPEQASADRAPTPATDVYSLGCVAYEMLTGDPPFSGGSAQAVLAKILMGNATRPTEFRKTIPAQVESAVMKAIEKLPADRFESVADFRRALNDPSFRWGEPSAAMAEATATGSRWRTATMALAAVSVVSLVALSWALTQQRGAAPVQRHRIQPFPNLTDVPPGAIRYALALAPDGSAMVVVDSVGGALRLKERDQAEGVVLSGTEGAWSPTFSPDGEWIAYVDRDGSRLRKVPRRGGASITLADSVAGSNQSVAWLANDTIFFNTMGWRLAKVSSDGGGEVTVVSEDRPGFAVRIFPLPDGQGVLTVRCSDQCLIHGVTVYDAVADEEKTLVTDATSAWYVPTGHLVYTRLDGAVFAAPFDLEALELTGPGLPVLEDVRGVRQYAAMQVGDDGTLVYLSGRNPPPATEGMQVVRVDRTGEAEPVDEDWTTVAATMALSPDGRYLAVNRIDGALESVWVKELPDGPETRLSDDGRQRRRPVWSPDGSTVAYQALDSVDGGLRYGFMARRADAATPAEEFLITGGDTYQLSWSRDGRYLVYRRGPHNQGGQANIHYREATGDTTDVPLLADPGYDEWSPELSPDGRWLAYLSTQSGETEVYVRPFPNVEDGLVKVSDGGGFEPAWSRDGTELFYRDGQDRMVSALVEAGPTFRVVRREPLFDSGNYRVGISERRYDVAPDGSGFYMFDRIANTVEESEDLGPTYVILVQNWFQELRELLGER